MAYTPTEWKCGDVITAEALNKLEGGVAEAIECCSGGSNELLVVNVTYDEATDRLVADKTYMEIYYSIANNMNVIFHGPNDSTSASRLHGSDIISWGFSLNGNSFVYFGYRLMANEYIEELG